MHLHGSNPLWWIRSSQKQTRYISRSLYRNPLSYDDKAIGTLMAFAEYGQIQLINSLCMAGATAPATLAGTVAVQNAESLAGIVLAQCVNPGIFRIRIQC